MYAQSERLKPVNSNDIIGLVDRNIINAGGAIHFLRSMVHSTNTGYTGLMWSLDVIKSTGNAQLKSYLINLILSCQDRLTPHEWMLLWLNGEVFISHFIYLSQVALENPDVNWKLLGQLFQWVNALSYDQKYSLCNQNTEESYISVVWQVFYIASLFNTDTVSAEIFDASKEAREFLLFCVDNCDFSQFLHSIRCVSSNNPEISKNVIKHVFECANRFPEVFERFLVRFSEELDWHNVLYDLSDAEVQQWDIYLYKMNLNEMLTRTLNNFITHWCEKDGLHSVDYRIYCLAAVLADINSKGGIHYILSNQVDDEIDDEIDDEASNDSSDEEFIDVVNHMPSKNTPLIGGIQDKYLGGNLPVEPAPFSAKAVDAPKYERKQVYIKLSSVISKKKAKNPLHIQYNGLDAEFYSTSGIERESNHKVTFVCAGRKESALLPEIGKNERVIAVLTKEELNQLDGIPDQYELLVINSLHSQHYGSYDNPGAVTSRRLAIFIFAAYSNFSYFMMLDDNIRELNYTLRIDKPGFNGSYLSVFDLLKDKLGNKVCLAVPTFSYRFREKKERELISKFFMINLADIREKLNHDDALLYLLFPEVANLDCWGEDYYFQIMLDGLFAQERQALGVVSPELVSLVRSKRHINAFRSTNKLAEPLTLLSPELAQNLTEEQREWISHGIQEFNRIVEQNKHRYQTQKSALESLDLLNVHASANCIESIQTARFFSVAEEELPFSQRWQSMGNAVSFSIDKLRQYQQKAIRHALNLSSGQSGSLIMATGSGKTRVQCELARLAYHAAIDGEIVFIVTPFIKLVDQFYQSFIEYNQQSSSDEKDLRVPNQNIIKISSDSKSCNLSLISINTQWKQNRAIFIFCQASFDKMVLEHPELMEYCSLLLLDEYHEYPKTLSVINDHCTRSGDNPLIIGSTATPGPNNSLPPLYTFTRKDGVEEGVLAAVLADGLGMNYSKKNLEVLKFNLVKLLSQIAHPGNVEGGTLSQTRGIIYLPSIKDCEEVEKILNMNGLKCYSIHSKNPTHKLQLDHYLNNREPAILLAVNMLGIGFDDPSLSWIMLAFEHQTINWVNLEQMIGRVMRKDGDKIGYVLGFNQIINQGVFPLLQDQPAVDKRLINPAYFNQQISYGAFKFRPHENKNSVALDLATSSQVNPKKRSLAGLYHSKVAKESASKSSRYSLRLFERKADLEKKNTVSEKSCLDTTGCTV